MDDTSHSANASLAPEPKISEREVEEIISVINKQFQEKVMDKIRDKGHAEPKPIAPGEGRSLQDYLSLVHAEGPSEPFADEDSNFDLSKLVKPPV